MISAGAILQDSVHWLRCGLVVAGLIVFWMICFAAINKISGLLYKARHRKPYTGSGHSEFALVIASGLTIVVAWCLWKNFHWNL